MANLKRMKEQTLSEARTTQLSQNHELGSIIMKFTVLHTLILLVLILPLKTFRDVQAEKS